MDPNTNLPPVPPQPAPQIPVQPPMPQPVAETPQALPPEPSVPAAAPAPELGLQPVSMPLPSQEVPAPMAIPETPPKKSRRMLLIILGVVLVLLIISAAVFIVASKATLIGSLSSDNYEGLTYQRPASWVKDSTANGTVGYHPKTSLGKGSDGKPTYALKMNVSAQKDVFHSVPNALKASDKAALQAIIDDEIKNASTDLLPTKSEVGCDTSPAYQDKPKKITISNSFLAVKYSFTCNSSSNGSATTFYYTVVDAVPNDKDIEYIVDVGAASSAIYKNNLTKIENILSNISF